MSIKLSRKEARPILDKTFPLYRGRKISLRFSETITFTDLNWSGGTKNTYAAVGVGGSSKLSPAAPWDNPLEGMTLKMRPDVAIVVNAFFCGKDMGIEIVMHPSQAPKLVK